MNAPRRVALLSSQILAPDGLRSGAVVIAGEQIEQVVDRASLPADVPAEDLGDLVVSPGLIDAHVHINEPGRTAWEGFDSATRAAAAGGATTLVDMPLNSSPVTTDVAALTAKRAAAAGQCWVDVGFYGGLIPGNRQCLPELVEAGVCGIKAFLCDSGLAEFPATPVKEVYEAMATLADLGVPLLVHAELPGNPREEAPAAETLTQLAASRRGWEERAVDALIDAARTTGCPTHIVHVASAGAARQIEAAKAAGVPITAETCPHYLTFCLEEIDDADPRYKCMPPITDARNRAELWEAMARNVLDTIGSDHSPCLPAMKETSLSAAWGGIASLELTLPAVWTGLVHRNLPIDWTARLLAAQPALLVGMANRKGRIAPGYDADLCIWDPDETWTVDGTQLYQRSPLTPYAGMQLRGRVQQTYVRGRLVYDRGTFPNPPEGQLLRREPPAAGQHPAASSAVARYFNALDAEQASARFAWCCAARRWVEAMVARRPFAADRELFAAAREVAGRLTEADWLEAFAAHPQIGDVATLRAKYAATAGAAAEEQAGTRAASEATLAALAEQNRRYLARHGFLFIVCATGKTAEEMLELLGQRLDNPRDQELQTAAEEQLKITELRLRKAAG